MKYRTILYSLLIASSAILFSCENAETKHEHDMEAHHDEVEHGNPQFADANMQAAYDDYNELTEALVASDAAQAQTHAAELQASLNAANASKAGDIAGEIAATNDLEEQRVKYTALSNIMEQVVKGAELSSGKLFKAYCPMANADEGGYWLTSESDINNPYFGDKMLKCGVIEETIE